MQQFYFHRSLAKVDWCSSSTWNSSLVRGIVNPNQQAIRLDMSPDSYVEDRGRRRERVERALDVGPAVAHAPRMSS